jgi:transposase
MAEHRSEVLQLIQRAASLAEVQMFFKKTYGYEPAAVANLLMLEGIEWAKSRTSWEQEERKQFLQELSCDDLGDPGLDRGQIIGWGV